MKWNPKSVVPPLGKSAIEHGNTDGGISIPLLFQHKSGKISFGQALMHKGTVRYWYPGEIGDQIWAPETDQFVKTCPDPIELWARCPSAEEIVARAP